MSNQGIQEFIDLLHKTHKAEWEATPSNQQAVLWLSDLIEFLFPDNHLNKLSTYIGRLKKNQIDLENILLSYLNTDTINIEKKVSNFYESLDIIYEDLRQDATKIYDNDPAATSVHEVIVSYPGFYAIAVYRIANRLCQLQIPILPRILSEHAHGKTGVDIHPNAKIGVPFHDRPRYGYRDRRNQRYR